MRILIAILTAAIVPAWSAAAQQADLPAFPAARPSAPDRCKPTAGVANADKVKPQVRNLAEMPPATQIYAVYNVVDGCPQPVVVRKGIGANPQAPTPSLRTPPRILKAN